MSAQSSYWKGILVLLLISYSSGARILGVVPVPAKSHNIVILSLMEELAARQHQVTVVTYHPQEKPRANYTDISLSLEKLRKELGETDMFAMTNMSGYAKVTMLWMMGSFIAEKVLQDDKVQKLIHSKDQQFDLVIAEAFFNEAVFGFAHKFKAPLVTVCPFGGTHWMGHTVGNPSPFSYVPDIFYGYTDHMTFTERLYNTLLGTFTLAGRALYYIPRQEAIMKKYFNFSQSAPSLWELQTRTSLFLANSHVSLNYPKPNVPNFIPVGGMHIKPPKKLPEDLQKYLDDAPNGVIYFSMGSALQSAKLPESKRTILLQTFSKLKQKVLWKWEDDTLPDQPANLKISKWFPQADVLAHPNIRLFITHGGLLSTTEAIYHGVPLIGIPVFGDQEMNMVQAQLAGYGVYITYKNLTSESLESALKEVLNEPRYRQNAKRLSVLYKDQPQTPMETAIYWIEYVLRHKGAPHLRSASLDLNWFQYFLLDVIAFLLIAVACIITIVYVLIKKVLGILCGTLFKKAKNTKEGKMKKKTN